MKRAVSLILIALYVFTFTSCSLGHGELDYSWADSYMYIAHGGGSVGGVASTNSREALQTNYDNGCRVFEIDLLETTDRELVCWHGWESIMEGDLVSDEYRDRRLSKEEFDGMLIAGCYHTMDFEYLARFMSEHDDVYVVTDMKCGDEANTRSRFSKLTDIADSVDPSILDRIIPQIYYFEMLETIKDYYDWRSVILTLYLIPDDVSDIEIVLFALENGIRVITVSRTRITEGLINDLTAHGIDIYMHTFNDPDEAAYWQSRGVTGFYTDSLMC